MRQVPGIALLVACLAVGLALAPAIAVSGGQAGPCVGTMTSPANGTTVISVQGQRFADDGPEKTPARLVAVGPRGELRWVHRSGREEGVVWSYDVDPLPNGDLFVTATRPGRSVFYEFDPRTGEVVREDELGLIDTHDADLLDRHRILIANMRNYDAEAGHNDDRLLIFNRTANETVWEWRFREHLPADGGGDYEDDWTHVNDVDRIAPGKYLASVRNFDSVVVVNRSSGAIEARLGADDDYGTLNEQHNPQYLRSEDGDPAILVADSGNDRIVEYERQGGEWRRTWELSGDFGWPRDADRLPNGNTLIVDSLNHRVLEVTPEGEVVWEVYSPWLVYDAERVTYGDEAGGPTTTDLGASGSYELSGATGKSEGTLEDCAESIRTFENPWAAGSPGEGDGGDGDDDATTATPGQPGVGVLAALVALFLAVGARYRT